MILFAENALLRCLLMLLLGASLAGCGGGSLSQEDLMRMSRRRPKDTADSAPATTETQRQADSSAMAESNPPAVNKPAPRQATASQQKPVSPPQKTAPVSTAPPPVDVAVKHEPLSDTRTKPSQQLSQKERDQLAAENLKKIGQALEAYRKDNGKYPPRAIHDSAGTPLLSWRVVLLPYLGHEKLYQAFDLRKPWNSPENKLLVRHIPAVYQSPERFDTRTNYLIPTGSGTIFPHRRTAHVRRIEDGVEHTLLALEVDDSLAVSWTKPQEYPFNVEEPNQGLGALRNGHTYILWGGGSACAVPQDTPLPIWKAMFTIDAGEPLSAYAVSVPLDEDFFAKLTPPAKLTPDNSTPTRLAGPAIGYRHPASALYQEYAKASQIAFQQHQAGNGLLWYYASCLLQRPGAAWDQAYRWIPALQRPSAAVHFCIGVRKKKSQLARLRTQSSPTDQQATRQKIAQEVTSVGEDFLEMIEEHAANLAPAALIQQAADDARGKPRRRRRTRQPAKPLPLSYLGFDTRVGLTEQATAFAGDVLMLFETHQDRSGKTDSVSFKLIDLVRNKEIVDIAPIALPLDSGTRDNSLQEKRWQLQDTLEDSLVFADWPSGLKPKHAKSRLTTLADNKNFNVLAALAEMSVYRNRGLVDNQQLLDGYRGLLGALPGETLLLGSDKRRRRTLRPWLPAEDPSELQQLAQARRNARDDDD